jgi:hypothetical protein
MSQRFKKVIIDDITAHNIDPGLQDNLLDLFESALKSVATTLACEAKFNTTDFETAKARGCEGFILLIRRAHPDSSGGWFGEFQRGDKRLEVISHFE